VALDRACARRHIRHEPSTNGVPDEGLALMILSRERSLLLVVDIQDRLMPAMHEGERVIHNTRILIQAARALGVPVLTSEQYPRGLGHTAPAVAELLEADRVFEKLSFSCCGDGGFFARLDALGRDQVVLVGVEAHVCVLQTALGLRAAGRACTLVADATSSRTPANADLAIARMRDHGVDVASTEMTVFEWLERAGTPEFKAVSALIK
jgi:nicotinamidase-related amidase